MENFKNVNLKTIDFAELANLTNENVETLKDLNRRCSYLGYVNNSTDAIIEKVTKEGIKKENIGIIVEFIHINIFNSYSSRFQSGRGYTVERVQW